MLRRTFELISLCTALAVVSVAAHAADLDADAVASANKGGPSGNYWVYIGSRVTGTGVGIVGAHMDSKTGAFVSSGMVVEQIGATTLAPHPVLPVVYSVSDPGNTFASSIYSYSQNPATGALTVKNSVLSGGMGATYLAPDVFLGSIFVANYGSGQVSWLPMYPDGTLGTVWSIATHYGTGPSPRQTAPHAHSVQVDPTKRFVLSPDLGADRIFVHKLDLISHELEPAATPYFQEPAGSGPRHAVFHPNGIFYYMASELSAEVSSYVWDIFSGQLYLTQTQPVDLPTFTGTKSASHIAISKDGRFVYITDRGDNTVVVYSVNPFFGTLTQIQRISSQGTGPWDFSLDPTGKWLVVANNTSGTINEFSVNTNTGLLTATANTFAVTLPSSVIFMSASN